MKVNFLNPSEYSCQSTSTCSDSNHDQDIQCEGAKSTANFQVEYPPRFVIIFSKEVEW